MVSVGQESRQSLGGCSASQSLPGCHQCTSPAVVVSSEGSTGEGAAHSVVVGSIHLLVAIGWASVSHSLLAGSHLQFLAMCQPTSSKAHTEKSIESIW